MEKVVCPFCQNELETINIGSPAYLVWDEDDQDYMYCPPYEDRSAYCPECTKCLPKDLVDNILTAALP